MPSSCRTDSSSPMMSRPSTVVSSGTVAISSIDTRAPNRTKARNRQRSPTVKPTTPDRDSHSQACAEASTGKATPRTNQEYRDSRTSAGTRRIRFSAREPIRRPAASKARAVTVQQQAVARAASSPAWGKGGSTSATFYLVIAGPGRADRRGATTMFRSPAGRVMNPRKETRPWRAPSDRHPRRDRRGCFGAVSAACFEAAPSNLTTRASSDLATSRAATRRSCSRP